MDVKTKLTVVILSLYIHKTISCTPNMNTTFYVNSISVKLGGKPRKETAAEPKLEASRGHVHRDSVADCGE